MPTNTKTCLYLGVLLMLTGGQSTRAQVDGAVRGATQGEAADACHESNLETHRDNPDMLVLPGLLADRKAHKVEILAEFTGIDDDDLVEFLLVDQASSHGYEALLWSFAKPSDVHRALEFIGLKPGSPVDPARQRFWTVGTPVDLSVGMPGETETVPIEELVFDNAKGETLPEEGFLFVGSVMVPPRKGQSTPLYGADVYDPRSIASVYNEARTVLDVPRKVSQGEVYGKLVINPEVALESRTLLTIVMTPGDPDGIRRARWCRLAMDRTDGGTGLVFRLVDDDQTLLQEAPEPTPILQQLVTFRRKSVAPYVDLVFDDGLPLGDIARTCVVMAAMEGMGMSRINPPADGQLYFKAFVPDRSWENPESRHLQPWELHLGRDANGTEAMLVLYEPIREEGRSEEELKRLAFDVSSPEEMRAKLDAKTRERRDAKRLPPPPMLLVYAPASMLYGDIMTFVRPMLNTHRTVYVFLRQEKTRPPPAPRPETDSRPATDGD